MSSTQEVRPGRQTLRRETVIMGRLDYISMLMRSIIVELYKIRRRMMSKVLIIIAATIIVITFSLLALSSAYILTEQPQNFLPRPCSQTLPFRETGCLDHEPTQQEAAAAKQAALERNTAPLRLPASLVVAQQAANITILLLIIILAGTIIGGEYSAGTIRLMLTRGPTRIQFFLSKVGAIVTCLGIGFLGMTTLGVLLGSIFNLLFGTGFETSFLTGEWILHAILYLLVAMLGPCVFALLALCLSTVGRATTAGVAGAIVWWVLEGALGNLLVLIGSIVKGLLGDFLRALPDYFISTNTQSLLQNQAHYLFGSDTGHLSDLHSVLVIIAYLVICIGLPLWIIQRRDVTDR